MASYVKRGDSYLKLAKLDDALADYNKVIADNSKYAAAFNGRGHITLRGDYTRAIADYSRAVELARGFSVRIKSRRMRADSAVTP
jgi:tetratricopeptide (TPR) repeat protein